MGINYLKSDGSTISATDKKPSFGTVPKVYQGEDLYLDGLWYVDDVPSDVSSTLDVFGDGSCQELYQLNSDALGTSGNHNATLVGSYEFTPARFGNGLKTTAYGVAGGATLDTSITIEAGKPYTFSFWALRYTNNSSQSDVISNSLTGGSSAKIAFGDNSITTWFSTTENPTPTVYVNPYDKLSHFMVEKDGTTAHIYQDGVYMGSQDCGADTGFNIEYLLQPVNTNREVALVDNIRIFTKHLTDEERTFLFTEELRNYVVSPTQFTYLNQDGKLLGVEVADGQPVDLHLIEDAPSLVEKCIKSDVIIANELKADNVATIVSELLGENGYRVWSDGLVEQWGVSFVGGTQAVLFQLEFDSVPFCVTFGAMDGGSVAYANAGVQSGTLTASGMTVLHNGAGDGFYYRAMGVIAQ